MSVETRQPCVIWKSADILHETLPISRITESERTKTWHICTPLLGAWGMDVSWSTAYDLRSGGGEMHVPRILRNRSDKPGPAEKFANDRAVTTHARVSGSLRRMTRRTLPARPDPTTCTGYSSLESVSNSCRERCAQLGAQRRERAAG